MKEISLPRSPGWPANKKRRDTAALRAMVQEAVLSYTSKRRAEDMAQGMSEEEAQKVIEEYSPVLELALIAVDGRTPLTQRIQCNAEAAQYLHSKLSAIKVGEDDEALDMRERRHQLAERLVNLLEHKAHAKANIIDAESPSD